MIIIQVSVHLGLLSIITISHIQYAKIIIIIDVDLVIFHDDVCIIFDSNTINDNSTPPSCCYRTTPPYKLTIIVAS